MSNKAMLLFSAEDKFKKTHELFVYAYKVVIGYNTADDGATNGSLTPNTFEGTHVYALCVNPEGLLISLASKVCEEIMVTRLDTMESESAVYARTSSGRFTYKNTSSPHIFVEADKDKTIPLNIRVVA